MSARLHSREMSLLGKAQMSPRLPAVTAGDLAMLQLVSSVSCARVSMCIYDIYTAYTPPVPCLLSRQPPVRLCCPQKAIVFETLTAP